MARTRTSRAFVPSIGGLESRALLTTFDPIVPKSIDNSATVIGVPGPLPVPPNPPELNKPLNPYNNTPIPDATWIII